LRRVTPHLIPAEASPALDAGLTVPNNWSSSPLLGQTASLGEGRELTDADRMILEHLSLAMAAASVV